MTLWPLLHQIAQTSEQFQFEQKVAILFVAGQVEVEARDESDQKLTLARVYLVEVLVLLAVLEQVLDARED